MTSVTASGDAPHSASAATKVDFTTYVDDTPDALWSCALDLLPSRDLLMAGQVCRAWKRASDALWQGRAVAQAVPATLGPSLRASVTRASIRETCLRAWEMERHSVVTPALAPLWIGLPYPDYPEPSWHAKTGRLVVTSNIPGRVGPPDLRHIRIWDRCHPPGPVVNCDLISQGDAVPWCSIGPEGRIAVMPLVRSDRIESNYLLVAFRVPSGALLHVTEDRFEDRPWLAICDAIGDEQILFKRPNAMSLRVVSFADPPSTLDVSAEEDEAFDHVMLSPRGSRCLVFVRAIDRRRASDGQSHAILAVDARDGLLTHRKDYRPGGQFIEQFWLGDEAGCAWRTRDGAVAGLLFDGDASGQRVATLSVHYPDSPRVLSLFSGGFEPIVAAWWPASSRVLHLLDAGGVIDCVDFSGHRAPPESRWTTDPPPCPRDEGAPAQGRWESASMSPDQQWLAFRSTKHLEVVRAETGESALAHAVAEGKTSLRNVAWAPNSRAFALFEETYTLPECHQHHCELRVFGLTKEASEAAFVEVGNSSFFMTGGVRQTELKWSTDGGELALSTQYHLLVFTWRPRPATWDQEWGRSHPASER